MFDLTCIATGFGLGLTAGLSPGPTQTLLISQTLRYGMKEGMLVAFAPLLTDLPIFLMTTLLLSQLSEIESIMGTLALIGAAFLLYLAYGNFKITGVVVDQAEQEAPGSLKKGVMTNFLNPYPYMFWLLVGAPLVMNAYQQHPLLAGTFATSFYLCLIGTLMSIAGLVGKSRTFLKGKAYLYTIRALGVLLLIFALRFIRQSLIFFGLL